MFVLEERETSRGRNNGRPFPVNGDPVTQDRNHAKHIRANRYKQRRTVSQEQVDAMILVEVHSINHGDIGGYLGTASPI